MSERRSSASWEEWQCHGGQARPCDRGNIWSRPRRISSECFLHHSELLLLGAIDIMKSPWIRNKNHTSVKCKENHEALLQWTEGRLAISTHWKSDNPLEVHFYPGTSPHCCPHTVLLNKGSFCSGLNCSPFCADSWSLTSKFQVATDLKR